MSNQEDMASQSQPCADASALAPLPCPFCGNSVADQSFWFGSHPGGGSYHVFCLECSETETTNGPLRATLEEAVAAWNRRAPEAAPNVSAALATYDAKSAECPLNNAHTRKRVGDGPCPRCKAGPSEGCGVEAGASAVFINAVRATVFPSPALEASTLQSKGG